MARLHHVTVENLPFWLDRERLLGPGPWHEQRDSDHIIASTELETSAAADLSARLRNMGLNGKPLRVNITPPLKRQAVRAARTEDAKRRRKTTPGFVHVSAKTHPEGRIGLTPEVLAYAIAKGTQDLHVYDACCGIGGNTIGFARAGAKVHSVEMRRDLLHIAQQNARIFGVSKRIAFHQGDTLKLFPKKTDICFVDPPWGLDWDKTVCSLDDFPLAKTLWETFLQEPHWNAFWLKVPWSFEPDSMGVPHDTRAVFGEALGDKQRIKFLLIKIKKQNLEALPH